MSMSHIFFLNFAFSFKRNMHISVALVCVLFIYLGGAHGGQKVTFGIFSLVTIYFVFLRQNLLLNLEFLLSVTTLFGLGWLASESPAPPVSASSAGITDVCWDRLFTWC